MKYIYIQDNHSQIARQKLDYILNTKMKSIFYKSLINIFIFNKL